MRKKESEGGGKAEKGVKEKVETSIGRDKQQEENGLMKEDTGNGEGQEKESKRDGK